MIAVDPAGQNQIVVAPGANALVSADDVEVALAALEPSPTDVLLASLEVPMAAVERAVELISRTRGTVVVNPAPAAPLPPSVMRSSPILTPNRSELATLSATDDPAAGAQRLIVGGAAAVVVTLGESGCLLVQGDHSQEVAAYQATQAIDTTGAGDTFSGVLAAWLAAGAQLPDAVRAGNAGAGLSVRSAGARSGMPNRDEVAVAMSDG